MRRTMLNHYLDIWNTYYLGPKYQHHIPSNLDPFDKQHHYLSYH